MKFAMNEFDKELDKELKQKHKKHGGSFNRLNINQKTILSKSLRDNNDKK